MKILVRCLARSRESPRLLACCRCRSAAQGFSNYEASESAQAMKKGLCEFVTICQFALHKWRVVEINGGFNASREIVRDVQPRDPTYLRVL